MAVCHCIPGRCCDHLKVCTTSPGQLVYCSGSTVKSWCITESEVKLLSQRRYGLLGWRSSTRQTLHIDESDWGDPSTTTLYECNWMQVGLGLCIISRRFVLKFAGIDPLCNHKLENSQPFHIGRLNKIEIESLKTLQHRLRSLPTQSLSGANRSYGLYPDACDKQVESVLLQEYL